MRFEHTLGLLGVLALATTSCNANLEPFVFNPIHCTNVTEQTCTEGSRPFDNTCIPCEQDYDFGADYPWPDDAFSSGPPRVIPDEAVERRMVPTDDGAGELDTYFVTAHGEDAELAQITIVYNHGNFSNVEHYLPRVRMLYEMGFNVLIWDFRGFGKSQPATTPTSDEFLADARQIRDLTGELAPDPDKVLVYGISLGAIPATEMALHGNPCALLLEAPFTSMQRIATRNAGTSLPDGFLTRGNFDNYSRISEYDGPLFTMIGDADELFTVQDATDFVDLAQGESELWVVPGARHGIGHGVPETGPFDTYVQKVRTFLANKATTCGVTTP